MTTKIALLFTFWLLNPQIEHKPCPMSGDARDARIQALDVLKNRSSIPANLIHVSLSDLIQSRNPQDFDQTKGCSVEGYIFNAKQEKGESCNCHSPYLGDWDDHIYFASTPNATGIDQCVVIESTPYTRSIHPEYTLEYLKSLRGKHIRVSGYLLYDFKHKDVIGKYRATVWEVHPITKVEIITS